MKISLRSPSRQRVKPGEKALIQVAVVEENDTADLVGSERVRFSVRRQGLGSFDGTGQVWEELGTDQDTGEAESQFTVDPAITVGYFQIEVSLREGQAKVYTTVDVDK